MAIVYNNTHTHKLTRVKVREKCRSGSFAGSPSAVDQVTR